MTAAMVFSLSAGRMQQAAATKFRHTIVRSQDPARIIELLNELPEPRFPVELAARAQALAVFPLAILRCMA